MFVIDIVLFVRSPLFWFVDPDMPEHNLEPPRFSRKALERILNDWTAVKAMLMTGCRESKSPRSAQNM